jgi:hypothetical protein
VIFPLGKHCRGESCKIRDIFSQRLKNHWWPEVESDWSVSGTDTGIFKPIGLPLRIDKSHEYCTLEAIVWMADGGFVEIYTCSS